MYIFGVTLLVTLAQLGAATNSTVLLNSWGGPKVTVSGFSSGGAMAGQMAVAHSKLIDGAGVLSAPPYFCTRGNIFTSLDCTTTGMLIEADDLITEAQNFEDQGLIDDLYYLRNKKIYIFSGMMDSIVWHTSVQNTEEFFKKLGANVQSNYLTFAEHSFPTSFRGNGCFFLGRPFISNCGFHGSERILEHILDKPLKPRVEPNMDNLKSFDQRKYQIGFRHSLAPHGSVYVPENCQNKR